MSSSAVRLGLSKAGLLSPLSAKASQTGVKRFLLGNGRGNSLPVSSYFLWAACLSFQTVCLNTFASRTDFIGWREEFWGKNEDIKRTNPVAVGRALKRGWRADWVVCSMIHVLHAVMDPQVHIKAVIMGLGVSSSTSGFTDVTGTCSGLEAQERGKQKFIPCFGWCREQDM